MAGGTVIRLVLVDDDPMVRMGLRLVLGGEADLKVVGEADNGAVAETVVRDTAPDVVLLDIRMPVQDGLVTTEHLLARPGAPAVVILTTFDADELVVRALGAGAAGYLLKDTPPPQLIEAVRAVARGEPMLSPSVTRQLIAAATRQQPIEPPVDEELQALTPREREVAIEVARGRSNAEIAATLYMSVATVKATLTRIFQKVGSENRVQLAMKVRDAGLL